MIRLVGNLANGYNLARLRSEAQTQWPHLIDLNDVGGKPAFYFESAAPTQAAIDALCTAHTPTPLPPSNEDTIRLRAETALTTNANFLAIPSPNNTQLANQVKALTRECSGIIRLLLNRTETTDGT